MIEYILLGIIQGITEWIPISSQGMLTLAGTEMGAAKAMDLAIWLHIGTLLAAVVYFRREMWEIIHLRSKRLVSFLFWSTLMTALVGGPLYLAFSSAIVSKFSGPLITGLIGAFLIINGLVQKGSKEGWKEENETKRKDAVVAGIAQGFAALPGISRSGMTMSALLFSGFRSESVIRLSFLMSIFSISLAQIGLVLRGGFIVSTGALVGATTAFVVGVATIGALIKTAKKIKFWKFCIFIGMIALISPLVSFFTS